MQEDKWRSAFIGFTISIPLLFAITFIRSGLEDAWPTWAVLLLSGVVGFGPGLALLAFPRYRTIALGALALPAFAAYRWLGEVAQSGAIN
jgi:hypothetical protein